MAGDLGNEQKVLAAALRRFRPGFAAGGMARGPPAALIEPAKVRLLLERAPMSDIAAPLPPYANCC